MTLNARLLAFALVAGLASLQSARAEFYLHHWENHRAELKNWHLSGSAGFYNTNTNFADDGAKATPGGLNKYSRFMTEATAVYGAHLRTNFYGRVTWVQVDLDATGATGTAYGLADQTFGMNYRLLEDKTGNFVVPMSMDIQVQADIPIYNNVSADAAGLPHLGDGSMDLSAGAFFTYPISESRSDFIAFTGGAGFTYRTAGFSSSLPWSLNARYSARDEGLILEAGVTGFMTLATDKSAKTGGAGQGVGGGGSLFANAINPSLTQFRGKIGYQLPGNLGFQVSGSTSIWGKSAPVGSNVFFGATLRLGRIPRENPARQTPKEYGRSNQGQIAYTGEARVLRMNDRLNLLKIDKGTQDGVEVGQIFDIFKTKPDGSMAEAVARAEVTKTQSNEAILTITEYFKEVWIDQGFVAKRPIP
ncbi:MAG: hypothetical protein AABZ55_14025 [Bdellovibrionota bacterium]